MRPILEYGAACWDPYGEGQIKALERVQRKRLNLQIIRAFRSGKSWRSLARQHAFSPFSKRTQENGLIKRQGTGYKDHAT